jgi:hypothetical protein
VESCAFFVQSDLRNVFIISAFDLLDLKPIHVPLFHMKLLQW